LNTPVRTAGLRNEFRTRDLPNIKQQFILKYGIDVNKTSRNVADNDSNVNIGRTRQSDGQMGSLIGTVQPAYGHKA
jgi:hypothetical protein